MSNSDGAQDAPPAGGALGRAGRVLQRLSSADDGGEYQGVLSYAAEWHSLVLGLAVGAVGTAEHRSAVVAYALGRGGGKRIKNDAAHIRDLAHEPAYALAGLVVGAALGGSLRGLGGAI